MRREFYDVYRDLYDIYRQSQYEFEYERFTRRLSPIFDRRNLRVVEDAINDATRHLPGERELRPDARLFLFVNAHQMVALPLAYSEGARLDQLSVDSALRSDLRTIVQVASEQSPELEITGHSIVSALDQMWGKLRTTDMNIWG